jgi:beta-lactamase superfamily II metal-dependent hydrolase
MGQWQHVGAANRLVMASHHGSQSANSVEWLDALRPDWVVAQAGYRNRYRHPAAAVQRRWAVAGMSGARSGLRQRGVVLPLGGASIQRV